ncbi:MAG: GNAT family N-acetyltransferase [Candidatus Taylorbacteria bacterium]|nr:GNAT family N-acetyltransferase [Candidatus Taylorbacteria bacterium]
MEKISGERIYLRKLTMEDATPRYCAWFNDPEVTKYLEIRSSNMDQLKSYVKSKSDNPAVLFMGIFDKTSDLHIGNVKLEPINAPDKRTIFSIVIGDRSFWGKGIGTEATRLITDHALRELGIDEVELGVIDEHKKASRAYERAGYKQVRIKKNAVNHDGIVYDAVIMVKRKEDLEGQK